MHSSSGTLSDLIPGIYFSLPQYIRKGFDLGHTWMVKWFFPIFFNLSLNLSIKSSWSEPQSAPGLVFADCIELLHLPYDPAIPLWGIHTEATRIERGTCTPIFIAALFTIARTWKQPRCPSADEWIRRLWYIYTMEYYSAIKKTAFEPVLMRWMKLEPIIQSEVSQKEKHQYCILTHI